MSLLATDRFFRSNVLKGVVDASLAANLPSSPQIGDRWRISVAGTFEGDTSILPNGYSFTVNDGIEWNGTNWLAQESGSDVWITGGTITGITDLAVADGGTGASDAATARTNLDVYSKAETDTEIDNDISTHNGVTTAHGISAFGSTLVDDADAATARATLELNSKTMTWQVAGASPQTAATGQGYLIDTVSSAYTLNLPASPTAGDIVGVTDFKGNAETNNITIGRNGSNIDGVAEDLIVDVSRSTFKLVYTDATTGWFIQDLTKVI